MITEKQSNSKWGNRLIEQMAKDLKADFPDLVGFSRSNLYSMRQFYLFYNEFFTFVHQFGGQIENNTFKTKTSKYKEIVHQLGG